MKTVNTKLTKNTGKCTIYILTHCESCYNRLGIFTGRINSRLTKNGHRHAARIARELKNKRIDMAYTSPLLRTKQTLTHILVYHKNTKVMVDKRLIERDYGQLSRKSKEKYKKEHPDLFPIYHRSYETLPPGGESIRQVEKRVMPLIKEIISDMKKDHINVLVVTHGNTIRPIRKYFENLTNEQMMALESIKHKVYRYKIT
ncbi:MAG: histidine phosphatase family protein [Bacteroidales bacterium]|nr:histidine phosphatase family protein [Bacteroidales bacterium]